MGKKRIIKKEGSSVDQELKARSLAKTPKKKITSGILNIQSTYNNTIINLTDAKGDIIMWSSCGSVGFKGAKKGTPYAASKVADILAEKAKMWGIKDVDVRLNGIGAGRESALRAFATKGININSIGDITPVPHGTPKAKKPRRV